MTCLKGNVVTVALDDIQSTPQKRIRVIHEDGCA